MKKIFFLCLVLVGCVYDVEPCEDCEEIKIISEQKEPEIPTFKSINKPEDPDTCERSNKEIHGCYEQKYSPKDDPRPEKNIYDQKIKVVRQYEINKR